ncbi:glycoside hydrolase family 2 protein [Glaciihabitans sp. UYNi722]|uniref:glycoside hydrolase family 2 protein n=1 Tax=Glaciihabitans sp. UYNi722 TaxID=3156344 RepID=UPI0033928C0C
MSRQPINSGWNLRATAGPVPSDFPESVAATVPGTVHTDLLAAGYIPDPYLDTNEYALAWIGESDFEYATTFDAGDEGYERVDLVAEGLDTVATLELNGARVGSTSNQHRSYRFDVRDLLKNSENELRIGFASALAFARAAEDRIGARPYVGNKLPYNAMRKMACNFGWDWGPVLVTAGIWKPIYLHRWSTARLASVVPQVTVAPDGTGHVSLSIDLERTSESEVAVSARVANGSGVDVAATVTSAETHVQIDLDVPDADLWWPLGYGEQALYQLTVTVEDGDTLLDDWQREIGFRTVELRMDPDEFGTSFQFFVNGQYVWIKGANWIPDDCFLPRITDADYAAGVRDAVDAGMNLLRIWGGGIYESDALYSECNRAGIMVWQDFLFACAAYSEEAELWDEVEAEVRENVARLAPHPSLVFWNGSNENIEGYYHWGWKEALGEGVSWGRGYYDDLIPGILAELDPTRSYTPSSPFSPNNYETPRDPHNGSVHSWEVWNRQDYTTYRDDIPRFVAEFGFQGPPNMPTLTDAIHDQPLASDSVGVLSHQKADDGNEKLRVGYEKHLPAPHDFDDWHFATQLNQARAISYGIEHFRSHSPRTAGTVIWQLNDCWPVTSWAAVDGARRRKPLWYALRALNAPRLLTIQPRPDGLALIASNDTASVWHGEFSVMRVSLSGDELARDSITIDVAPRSNATVTLDPSIVRPDDAKSELIVVRSAEARSAYWYFVEDTELALDALDLESTVTVAAGGYTVDIRANAFAKDLVLNADRLDPDAVVDDALITLLPGETHRFTVASTALLETEQLVAHPVLQSVNNLTVPHAVSKGSKA